MPTAEAGTYPNSGSATGRYFRPSAAPILHSPSRPLTAAPPTGSRGWRRADACSLSRVSNGREQRYFRMPGIEPRVLEHDGNVGFEDRGIVCADRHRLRIVEVEIGRAHV